MKKILQYAALVYSFMFLGISTISGLATLLYFFGNEELIGVETKRFRSFMYSFESASMVPIFIGLLALSGTILLWIAMSYNTKLPKR